MVPHKKTGKPAIFQTREEDAQESLKRGVEVEIVRKGDTFKQNGNDVMVRPEAVTADDIRIVVPGDADGVYAHVGPWNKPSERAAMEKAWDEANA